MKPPARTVTRSCAFPAHYDATTKLEGETITPSRDERAYLRLDPQGFTAYPTDGGEKGRAWTDVSGFKPADVASSVEGVLGPPLYQIGFFLSDPPKKGRVARWVLRRFNGVDDTLPGVYPDADEVVALMERWRQQYSSD